MKNKKILKITGFIIKFVIGIMIFAFIASILLQRFSNNQISFFNFRMFSVLTGSMEPEYMVGDVLISKEVDIEDIKIGDAVSYLGDEGGFKDKVVTHEVVGIEENEEGDTLFRTKGIANPIEDPIVHEDQIYGVVVYKPITLSFMYKVVSNPIGMYTCIILPMFAIVGYEIVSRMLEKEEEKRSKY